jgi:hypothetical protein
MRVGRRRVAVVATVLVAIAAGTGVARAYYAPGTQELVANPGNYFAFCSDRQLDVAGISPADLQGNSNGGHDYTVQNFLHDSSGYVAGQPLAGTTPFVLGKSGIGYQPLSGGDYDRRILTTQLVEYDTFGGEQVAVQVRCKMRSQESLNRPESEKQRFDNGTASPIPWGFGPGTASGVAKSCLTLQAETAAAVWAGLTPAEKDSAVYRWAGDAPDGDPANIDMATEVLPEGITGPNDFGTVTPETNVFIAGSQWTAGYDNGVAGLQPGDGFDSVRAKGASLEIRSAKLEALSTSPNPIGDRVVGAYYCTFSTPEYLKAVFLGDITPPAAVT